MIRISRVLAALAFTSSAFAHTVPQTAASQSATPPAAPAAAPRDPAAINALLTAPLSADQAAMKAHVLFLASDAMKGREAGSPEFDIAAQYVAAQFYAAGLRPAGDDGGYLQRVPLVTYKAADQGAMVWSGARGAPQPLVFGEDYVPAANPARADTVVSAPVVFAGRGIVAPQLGVDDYAGVDVRGKIVALFGGSPTTFPGEERSYFGSPATKAQIAAARAQVTDAQGWRQSFRWPATGRISGLFGAQRIYRGEPGAYHSGTDIARPTGTPVAAPADGVVILAADKPFTLEGNLLMIDHGNGLNSAFLHLSRIDVKVGDHVRQGQILGAIGATGRATGPHLHWSLRWCDARLDPMLVAGAMERLLQD